MVLYVMLFYYRKIDDVVIDVEVSIEQSNMYLFMLRSPLSKRSYMWLLMMESTPGKKPKMWLSMSIGQKIEYEKRLKIRVFKLIRVP